MQIIFSQCIINFVCVILGKEPWVKMQNVKKIVAGLMMMTGLWLAWEGGFDFFTTTLTISPLKNAAKLNEIGEELGEIYGVRHLPSDFKKKGGYQRSVQLSHEYNMYRQDYCGCVFSKAERDRRLNNSSENNNE